MRRIILDEQIIQLTLILKRKVISLCHQYTARQHVKAKVELYLVI